MSQFRRMEYKVGLFVLFSLVTMVGLIVYVGYKKELFSEKVYFYLLSTTGENIERGMPVRLSGYTIGEVNEVELQNVGNIKVQIRVLKKYMRWFRKNSTITVSREGLFGNPYLKVIPGDENSPVLEPGSQIGLEFTARSISDLVAEAQPAVNDLKIIVSNIRTLTDQFVDRNGTVQQVLANLEQVSSKLGSNQGLINYVLTDPSPARKVDNILDNAQKSMGNVAQLSTRATLLAEEIQQTITEGHAFLAELRDMNTQIQPILANLHAFSQELERASRELDRFRTESEQALDLGTEVLHRFKETWPLSRPEDSVTIPELPAP